MKFNGQIEQTLHGYDGGHRLLASSTNLSPNEKKYLLELSDLSGSRASGFNEYLTGYLIPGSKKYAFSKTWYADEMERPGCVWTHTLLINQDNFLETSNLQSLLVFFKRPHKGKYQEFKKSIIDNKSISSQNYQNISLFVEDDNYLLYANIFHQLYERINKVVIVSDNSLKYEKFILSFWSQMWSSLRPKFSFCTGSFSCRMLKGEPFIIQVIPSQNAGAFRSEFASSNNLKKKPSKLVIIEEEYLPTKSLHLDRYNKIYHSFLSFLLNNENLNSSDLLQFVWHYGGKLQPFRKNFGWLVKFYELIHQEKENFDELNEIAKALIGKFTNNNLEELKLLLFGNPKIFWKNNIDLENPFYIKPLGDENIILKYLLKTEYSDFFDVDNLYLAKRFELLWKDFPQVANYLLIDLCSSEELNKIQLTFLETSAKTIEESLFGELLKKRLFLAKLLLKKNPWLAVTKDIWNLSGEIQDEIFEALTSTSINNSHKAEVHLNWKKIVWAMLEYQNDVYVNRIYELFGDELIEWVLDWHSIDNNDLKGGWKSILSKSSKSLMSWVVNNENKIRTKGLIAQIMNPNLDVVRDYGSSPWLRLASNIDEGYTQNEISEINCFLLSLGLANTDFKSKILVAKSFSSVYNSAENNHLTHTAWSYLEPVVPDWGLFFGWDMCRRLEEAIVNLILEKDWDIQIILDVATSEHILLKLVKRIDNHYKVRRLLWKLGDRIQKGTVKVNKWQKRILAPYCK